MKSNSRTECAAIFKCDLQGLIMPEVVVGINVAVCAVDNLPQSKPTSELEAKMHGLLSEFSDIFSKIRRDYGITILLTQHVACKGNGRGKFNKAQH